MTTGQALEIIKWIPKDKIKSEDKFFLGALERNISLGVKIDARESAELQKIYRYAQGSEKQDQPFKQYRRKKSRGI